MTTVVNTLTDMGTYTISAPYHNMTMNGISSTDFSTISTATLSSTPGLRVSGDLELEGELRIKGKDLNKIISDIEQRLAILHVNPGLEEKWQELKNLGDQYRALEAEILEKERMWKVLTE